MLSSTAASAPKLRKQQLEFQFKQVFICFGVHFNPTLLKNVQKESTLERKIPPPALMIISIGPVTRRLFRSFKAFKHQEQTRGLKKDFKRAVADRCLFVSFDGS